MFASHFPAPRDDPRARFLDSLGEGPAAPTAPSRRPWRWAMTVLRSCSGPRILADFCSLMEDCYLCLFPGARPQNPLSPNAGPSSLSRSRPGPRGDVRVPGTRSADSREARARPQACGLSTSVPLVLHVLATGGLMLGSCVVPPVTSRSKLRAQGSEPLTCRCALWEPLS